MSNRITELEISNFKSIKHIKMDCRRINVLIGRPNVGKSNILEALALFSDPYTDGSSKFLGNYIRYEQMRNLFYDQDRNNNILVKNNLGFASIKADLNQPNSYDFLKTWDLKLIDNWLLPDRNIVSSTILLLKEMDINRLDIKDKMKSFCATLINDLFGENYQTFGGISSPVKKYYFKTLSEHKSHFQAYLNPPFGDNLCSILESNSKLYDELSIFLKEYGLNLAIDTVSEKLVIIKQIGNRVYSTPYSLTADTLQRVIFHIAAVRTNTDSILLFEEPENHSFPPYIKLLGEEIIESATNQYFIATHSTDLLTPFIEQCPPEDLAIFVVDYENYETNVKLLSDAEIENIMEIGIANIFYNLSLFNND